MVFVDDVFFSVLITMPFSRSAYPMSCVPLPFSLGTFLTSILFQSTLSVRRATWSWRSCRRLLFISIHALREESDQQPRHRKQQRDISIHALREESDLVDAVGAPLDAISIHALREESDGRHGAYHTGDLISIHALREESDATISDVSDILAISIHALREESDVAFVAASTAPVSFQSTLSVRRATRPPGGQSNRRPNFNPRSP